MEGIVYCLILVDQFVDKSRHIADVDFAVTIHIHQFIVVNLSVLPSFAAMKENDCIQKSDQKSKSRPLMTNL